MSYRTLGITALLAATLLLPDSVAQQELGGAKVTDEDGHLVVSAEVGRPLYFALLALSEKYGWVVDYEDPVYSRAEARDATDPTWRQEHPNGRRFYEPADRKFSAILGRADQSNPDEFRMVGKLVDLYNSTANPGSFQIVRTGNGRVAVAGKSRVQALSPLPLMLDQQMQPSQDRENASDALQRFTSQCGASDVPIEMGTVPSNALATSTVDGYDRPITCREQLGRILAALHHPARYALLYDINTRAYYVNIVPAHRLVIGPNGKPTVVPIQSQ